jgi:hypothetical protein
MKVYLVFKYEDGIEQAVKGFTNKEKMEMFVDHKNNTTAAGWYHQEIEVEG